MSADAFIDELDSALEEYRFEDVGGLLDGIDPSTFDQDEARRVLNMIRRKRLFPELEKAAALFSNAGHREPGIRRQYAQALLDQNRIDQGVCTLDTILPEVRDDPKEGPEVRGLLGRAFKQRHVNDGDTGALVRSIKFYRQDWQADPEKNRWHGINLVALLKLAAREGIDPKVTDDADEISRRILSDIKALDEPSLWDYGTAMEAAVSLEDKATALRWAKKYARHPRADEFELGSTVRQMKEIWQLEGTELGDALLPVLEYELLQRQGARHHPVTDLRSGEGFEAVYGPEGAVQLEWMETLLSRCRAIARVFVEATGRPEGTGFALKGSALKPEWGDRPVFVTNSHVVSNDPADQAPIQPGEGSAEFTRLEGRPKVQLGRILRTSPKYELDYTVLEIPDVTPADLQQLEPTVYLPQLPEPEEDRPQRIYVIGHPSGRDLAVSLYDNRLSEYEGSYVRYRSPTEGGNSGSPVFTRKWRAFAVHHRAIEEKQLNEGILIKAILDDIQGDSKRQQSSHNRE